MYSLILDYQKELWTIATIVFGFLLTRWFRMTPRLNYSVGHSWNFLVDQPLFNEKGEQLASRQIARTASITAGNSGLSAAKAVEITFNWKPQILNVWPARAFKEDTSLFDRYSLRFESLAPSEQITIEIMAINSELPLLTSVRCDDCTGKQINMSLQRLWSKWVLTAVGVIMLLGAGTLVYFIVSIAELLLKP